MPTEPPPRRLAGRLALVGCGGGPGGVAVDPKLAAAAGPHGGPAVPLSDGAGYAKILTEPIKPATKSGRRVTLAVDFLGPDLKTASTPPPAGVSASVTTLERPEPTPVPLAHSPDKASPMAASRFVSEVGPFDFDELQGELTGNIDGRPFARPFAPR